MNESGQYSLCVAYPRQGHPEENMWFRIADYFPAQHRFFPIKKGNENPSSFWTAPKDARKYAVDIRFWTPNSFPDGKKPPSTHCDVSNGTIYEVCFAKKRESLGAWNTREIQEMLFNGIEIDESVGEDFLLAVAKSGTTWCVLQCNKRNFKGRGNRYTIDRNGSPPTIYRLNQYSINQSSLIDTSMSNIEDGSRGGFAPVRYFYTNTTLPSHETFYVRSIEDYLPCYIQWFVNHQEDISRSKRQEVIEIIQHVIAAQTKMDHLSECVGCSFQQIISPLQNLIQKTPQILEGIEKTLLSSPNVREKCLEQVRKQHNVENDEACRDTEQKKLEKQRELKQLEEARQEFESKYQTQHQHYEELKAEIQTLTTRKEQIQLEIQQELEQFQTNIVHTTAISAIINATRTEMPDHRTSSPAIYVAPERNIPERPSVSLTTKEELFRKLCDNLIAAGIAEEYSEDMASTILAALSCKFSLVLYGMFTEHVADAISLLLDGTSAPTLVIPTGFTDLNTLISVVQAQPGRVVLLKNTMDCMHESLLFTLIERFPEKIFLFALWNSEIIHLISRTFWAKSLFLDLNMFADIPSGSMYRGKCDCPDELMETEIENSQHVEWFEGWREQCVISNFQAIQYKQFLCRKASFSEECDGNSPVWFWHLMMTSGRQRPTLWKILQEEGGINLGDRIEPIFENLAKREL